MGSSRDPIPRSSGGRCRGRKGGRKKAPRVVPTTTPEPLDEGGSKHETVLGESIKFNERTLIPIVWDHLLHNLNHRFVVPNVYMGKFEADVVGVDREGYGHEFEIKTSKEDFIRDFKDKPRKHYGLERSTSWQKSFTYVAPAGIIPLDLLPPYASLVEITYAKRYKNLRYSCRVDRVVKARPNTRAPKLTTSQITKLAVSLSHRFFATYKNAASHLGGCNFNEK